MDNEYGIIGGVESPPKYLNIIKAWHKLRGNIRFYIDMNKAMNIAREKEKRRKRYE